MAAYVTMPKLSDTMSEGTLGEAAIDQVNCMTGKW